MIHFMSIQSHFHLKKLSLITGELQGLFFNQLPLTFLLLFLISFCIFFFAKTLALIIIVGQFVTYLRGYRRIL